MPDQDAAAQRTAALLERFFRASRAIGGGISVGRVRTNDELEAVVGILERRAATMAARVSVVVPQREEPNYPGWDFRNIQIRLGRLSQPTPNSIDARIERQTGIDIRGIIGSPGFGGGGGISAAGLPRMPSGRTFGGNLEPAFSAGGVPRAPLGTPAERAAALQRIEAAARAFQEQNPQRAATYGEGAARQTWRELYPESLQHGTSQFPAAMAAERAPGMARAGMTPAEIQAQNAAIVNQWRRLFNERGADLPPDFPIPPDLPPPPVTPTPLPFGAPVDPGGPGGFFGNLFNMANGSDQSAALYLQYNQQNNSSPASPPT